MKTLVYFASGGRLKEEYDTLPFDRVILIDKAGNGVPWQRLALPLVACRMQTTGMLSQQLMMPLS